MTFTRRGALFGTAALTLSVLANAAPADDDTFRMGLLVPGSVAEEGWNRIAYDALKRVEAELGAEISYVELQEKPAAFETAFRNYAGQGYDVVLGHGFQFQDAALTVAPEFPETTFLISSSHVFEDNVVGLNTDASQPFYLMGVIAAKAGDSAGLVGGMEIPPIRQAFEGFKNGAKSVDPSFRVSEIYINSFTDISAAKEATLGLIAQGADFVVPNANAAGLGVVQAASETGSRISTYSVYSDHTEVAPENILGVFVADYGQGIVRIASEVKEGSFAPDRNIEFGLKDADVIKFSLNDQAANPVSEEVRTAVEEAKSKIVSGEVQTRDR